MPCERRPIIDRDEWLQWRRADVTASDVAAVFGLSPFKTPLRLWAEKTGRYPDKSETMLMRRGRWLEPAVLTALAESYRDQIIVRPGEYFRDPETRLAATPDAFMGNRLVECKVVSRPVFEAWDGDVPIYYQLQAATGALLANVEAAIIAVLVIDTFSATLELFHVQRSEAAENRIREGIGKFWRDLADGIQPAAEYETDGAILADLYRPKEEIAAIDLSSDNLLPELLAERAGLHAAIKTADTRLNAIKGELIDKLKGAPAAICNGWKIKHRMAHRKETVLPATSYPVLTVTAPKKEQAA